MDAPRGRVTDCAGRGPAEDTPLTDLFHDDGPLDATDARTVLISGPPMSGKDDLVHELLGRRETGLLISIGRDAAAVRVDHADVVGGDRPLHVIDCSEGGDATTPPETGATRQAAVRNLTGLGVTFTALADELAADGESPAVGLCSLSHLLAHFDRATVVQFTRTLAEQAAARDWPFVATLDGTAHDRATRHALHGPFDRLVETRLADGARQVRIRGRLDGPSDWVDF